MPHSLKGEAIYVFVTLMHGLEMTPALQKELKQVGLALQGLPTANSDCPLPSAPEQQPSEMACNNRLRNSVHWHADLQVFSCISESIDVRQRLHNSERDHDSPGVHAQPPPRQTVRKEIGAFAVPDTVHWAPGLPKTRSGD